jgi:hypothetical protein
MREGFVIAPFFPVGVSILTKTLPRELHTAAIGRLLQQGVDLIRINNTQASQLLLVKQVQQRFLS